MFDGHMYECFAVIVLFRKTEILRKQIQQTHSICLIVAVKILNKVMFLEEANTDYYILHG